MKKSEAIKRARKEVTENATWDSDKQAWWTGNCPAGRNKTMWIRDRRIQYALELLEVDGYDAWGATQQQGSFVDIINNYNL